MLAMGARETSFRLAAPGRVTRLVLERDQDELSIVLRILPEADAGAVEVRCSGAYDVQFLGERTELNELVLLLAEDVSSSGWEGAKFRVMDSEEELISFVCREIDPFPSR